jgi:cytolysin-activating lysine-acyltransferase
MAKKFPGEGKEAAAPQQAKSANGHAVAAPENQPAIDPAVLDKIKDIRARVHETFGKVALAMMAVPRYRHLSIADLQQLVLEPLIRDRIAIAQPAKEDGPQLEALAGIAIWASVSAEVDAKIREQIKASIFPVRLKPDEWTSGDINWLIDVIAPSPKLATAVIANFKQVIKQGDLRIHPLVTRLVDAEALKKMGAAPIAAAKAAAEA